VANLWTEFSAHDRYAMGRHVKEWKIAENFLVAASLEKPKT